MTQDPPRLGDVFSLALAESSPGARAALIERECQGDPELRDRVEALLAAHDGGGSLLALPQAKATTPFETITERPGTVIGPYKLLQQIGEGGMGVVFMAEQTKPLQRMVALKIIKPGMDTRQVIARFESERQALAMMDHPNIAKVLDAGTTDTGRPYFVMELVKGVPITQFCDDKHLSLRERLELLLPVCQAVQHAHQKGVIHRDIKPSNVLVANYDDQPVPKVIDFGVAKVTASKLTEKTMFTEFGQIVGTLEYMSPEQATFNQLDIDTRSDIYSLGVLLYELLAGSTPFEGKRLHAAAFDEMLRIIREEEPPKPSTRLSSSEALPSIAANRHTEPVRLSKDVRGELDWIVMKALEKDRNRRYETANGLAADLRRYLDDEAVLACPPAAAYRFQKFARRNKPALLTAALIASTLILGTVVSTWQAIRASRAEAESLAQANEARQSEAQTQAVLDFVQNKIFAAARPEGEKGGLGHDVTLRQAIEAAIPYVETSFRDQPLIEGQLRNTLGWSFYYLGEADKAAEQFQKGHKILEVHLGSDHPDTLHSMNGLGASYSNLGRYDDALKLAEETLALREVKLGPYHRDTLMSMNNLAACYLSLGRHAEAIGLSEKTLALQIAKLGPDHPDTLRSMTNLANTYSELGRYEDALKLREETLELLKTKLGPEHPDTLGGMSNVACVYSDLGRYEEALKLNEESLALMKAKLGHDHPGTLNGMNNLANSYYELGRYEEAIKLEEEALELKKAKLGADHPSTLMSMQSLSVSYSRIGRHAEALQLNEEALAMQKTKLGLDHPDTLMSMMSLASIYSGLGCFDEALELREQTLVLMKTKLGHDHLNTLASMMNLAGSYSSLGRYNEALELCKETVALMKAKFGPDHPQTLVSMLVLASIYSDLGRFDEALELCEEVFAKRKAKLGPNHPETLRSMLRLASSYSDLGRHEEALKLCEDTWTLQRSADVLDHLDAILSINDLAALYGRLGKYAEARELGETALALSKAKLGPNHPITLASMQNLACTYSALGQYAKALELLEEKLALLKAKSGPDDPLVLQGTQVVAETYANLGDELREQGKLDEAIAAWNKAIERNPDHVGSLFGLAMSFLNSDSHAEYRLHCHEMLKRFDNNRADGAAEGAAIISLLLPVSDSDFERACELADFTEIATEQNGLLPWMHLAKALAEYRRERFKSAITSADRCASVKPILPECAAAAWFVRAMANARLQRQKVAQIAFVKGEILIERPPTTSPRTWLWHDVAQHLRGEAAELLEASRANPATDAKPPKDEELDPR